MSINSMKKGVALIWTLLTISILLIVTTTMANYIVLESRMSVRIEDSTQAYATAQSGIEWAKECIAQKGIVAACGTVASPVDAHSFVVPNDEVKISVQANTPSVNKTTIVSEGIYAGVGRKLQYVVGIDSASVIANTTVRTSTQLTADKSYDFQFDIWGGAGAKFGLSNTTTSPFVAAAGKKTVGFYFNPTTDDYWMTRVSGASALPDIAIDLSGGNIVPSSIEYAMRVKVRYLQETAIQMTVEVASSVSGQLVCSGSATWDLQGTDFSMPSAYFVSDQAMAQNVVKGDGDVISIGGANAYIDNIYSHGVHSLQYSLTVIAGTGGSVSGGGFFNPGSTGTGDATANSGYSFDKWTCDSGFTSAASHLSILMDGSKSCTASFVSTLGNFTDSSLKNNNVTAPASGCYNTYNTDTYSHNNWTIVDLSYGGYGDYGLTGGIGSTTVQGWATDGCDDYADSSVWISSITYRDPSAGLYIQGGMVTFVGGREIHTFTSSGQLMIIGGSISNADVLIVGGGGGGGLNSANGGGGGGGFLSGTLSLGSGTTAVSIGQGGGIDSSWSGGTHYYGANGGNSSFGSYIANGGGGGGGPFCPVCIGRDGGSGGGGFWNLYSGGSSSQTSQASLTGYGFSGGRGNSSWGGAGGGAGGSAAGVTSGPGRASSISGASVTYGAGGPGSIAVSGAANTGNGGGTTQSGGSGIVIISFPIAAAPASGTVAATNPFTVSLGFLPANITCTNGAHTIVYDASITTLGYKQDGASKTFAIEGGYINATGFRFWPGVSWSGTINWTASP